MSETEIKPAPTATAETDELAFKKVIEESKNNIAQAQTVELEKKRGRGRPRKTPPAAPQAPVAPVVDEGITQAPDLSQFLAPPLKMLSGIPAKKYQLPELAFTDDEAKLCAESLNQVIQAFVPDIGAMSPKTAAVIGACAVFGSIGISKYGIYQSKMRTETQIIAEKAAVEQNIPEIKTTESPELPTGIQSSEYFRTMSV